MSERHLTTMRKWLPAADLELRNLSSFYAGSQTWTSYTIWSYISHGVGGQGKTSQSRPLPTSHNQNKVQLDQNNWISWHHITVRCLLLPDLILPVNQHPRGPSTNALHSPWSSSTRRAVWICCTVDVVFEFVWGVGPRHNQGLQPWHKRRYHAHCTGRRVGRT